MTIDLVTRHQRLVWEYWPPLLLWVLLIYYGSTDDFSASRTSGIVVPMLHFLFPRLSPDELAFSHGVIRKMGHVSVYCVLALLAYRAIKFDEPELLDAKLLSFQFVVLTAMTDEFHQSMTMWRGASIVDVGYDSLGGLIALTCITALRR
jgi:VanZ family protein